LTSRLFKNVHGGQRCGKTVPNNRISSVNTRTNILDESFQRCGRRNPDHLMGFKKLFNLPPLLNAKVGFLWRQRYPVAEAKHTHVKQILLQAALT